MYRQNKQFMKNPATAPARIYIGGLQSTIVSDDLDIKFSEYGTILGLSLQKGFAFIQYETPENAKRAISAAHGSLMHGKKISVKPANVPKNKNMEHFKPTPAPPNPPENPPPPPIQREPDMPPKEPSPPKMTPDKSTNKWDTIREDSPENFDDEQPEDNKNFEGGPRNHNENYQEDRNENVHFEDDSQNKNNYFDDMQIKTEKRSDTFDDVSEPIKKEIIDDEPSFQWNDKKDRNQGRPPFRGKNDNRKWKDDDFDFRNDRKPKFPRNQKNERMNSGPMNQNNEMYGGNNAPFFNRYGNFPNYPPAPVVETPERNDCEIIVVAKQLTEYAEYIEQRLKAVGLIVDLLFPNEDVPIGKVLANISSRGCLYAILVMPINKENKSLTLNILHGISQEHRNIPLDDAILLITRNFDAYMRGEKTCPDSLDKLSVHDKHPHNMQVLINIVAENRTITSIQYNDLIKYLEERRDLQLEYEEQEGIEVNANKLGSKEAELQNRILSILNNKNNISTDTQSNVDSDSKMDLENSNGPEPTPLLKDPTVQKALDSLNLGDIFKNLSSLV